MHPYLLRDLGPHRYGRTPGCAFPTQPSVHWRQFPGVLNVNHQNLHQKMRPFYTDLPESTSFSVPALVLAAAAYLFQHLFNTVNTNFTCLINYQFSYCRH